MTDNAHTIRESIEENTIKIQRTGKSFPTVVKSVVILDASVGWNTHQHFLHKCIKTAYEMKRKYDSRYCITLLAHQINDQCINMKNWAIIASLNVW